MHPQLPADAARMVLCGSKAKHALPRGSPCTAATGPRSFPLLQPIDLEQEPRTCTTHGTIAWDSMGFPSGAAKQSSSELRHVSQKNSYSMSSAKGEGVGKPLPWEFLR